MVDPQQYTEGSQLKADSYYVIRVTYIPFFNYCNLNEYRWLPVQLTQNFPTTFITKITKKKKYFFL